LLSNDLDAFVLWQFMQMRECGLLHNIDSRQGKAIIHAMKLISFLSTALSLFALTTATVSAAPKPEQPKFLARCDCCNKEQTLTPTLVLFNGGFSGMNAEGVMGNTTESTLTFKCKYCKKHTFTMRHEFFTPAVRTVEVKGRQVPVPAKAVPVNSAATNQAALLTLAPKPPKVYRSAPDLRFQNPMVAARP
jgi:hypothetical protein